MSRPKTGKKTNKNELYEISQISTEKIWYVIIILKIGQIIGQKN